MNATLWPWWDATVSASESSVRHGSHQLAQTVMTIGRPWSRRMRFGNGVDVLRAGGEAGLVAVLSRLRPAVSW